jgi:DNA helicase HerA-like ATPase
MTLEVLIGGSAGNLLSLPAKTANRHGIIAGATGTGKTVTLQTMAEGFSRIGVPVFMSDIKGDLSGLAQAGGTNKKIHSQLEKIALTQYSPQPTPTLFWDIFGRQGHPVRTTISDMGPLLLSNLFELNDTQTGVLYSAFDIADENGMLLLDLKDLRSMLSWMSEAAKELQGKYGNISASSVGAIQRRLLILEEQGAESFFGEPALRLEDLMMTDFSGQGVVSVFDASDLMHKSPRLYATFMLWLLSELFEQLPEAGDLEKPKMVLFFDEAHLLFDRAPRALIDKVEQVVRLIRSKGVGIYFVTQSPLDIPSDILGQLASRVQHALRAYTPKDKKVVKVVAETFRENPKVYTAEAITNMATGEALVSVLNEDGSPTPVEQIFIAPPRSRIGPLTPSERHEVMSRSPLKGRYDELIDRESAFEMLKKRAEEERRTEAAEQAQQQQELLQKREEKAERTSNRSSNRQGIGEAILKSVARSVGSSLGRRIVRGILGSLLGGR